VRLVKQKYTVVTAGVSSEVMESMFKSYEGEAKDYASKLLKAWIPVLSNKEQVKWVAKRLRAFCDRKFFKKENPLADDYVALYDLFGKFRDTKKDAEESKFKTLKALKFAPDATPEEAVNAIKQAFNDAFDRSKSSLVDTSSGEPETLIKFPNGYEWQILPDSSCGNEGEAMRHCGNSDGHPDDKMLSLREPVKKGGKLLWRPHLTFIVNNGLLTQMKGKANQKPDKKYHPYIIALLKDPIVEGIIGGGFDPHNNFALNDLAKETQKKLISEKPALDDLDEHEWSEGNINMLKDYIPKMFRHSGKGDDLKAESYDDALDEFVLFESTLGENFKAMVPLLERGDLDQTMFDRGGKQDADFMDKYVQTEILPKIPKAALMRLFKKYKATDIKDLSNKLEPDFLRSLWEAGFKLEAFHSAVRRFFKHTPYLEVDEPLTGKSKLRLAIGLDSVIDAMQSNKHHVKPTLKTFWDIATLEGITDKFIDLVKVREFLAHGA